MLSRKDRLLLSIEQFPLNILYRAAIGYGLLPLYLWSLALLNVPDTTGMLVLCVAGVLVALRLVPGVLRRMLPASRELKAAWAHRRELAQSCDSFQWRKLFGIGLGWLAHLGITHNARVDALTLAIAFVLAGAAGQLFWIRLNRAHLPELSS